MFADAYLRLEFLAGKLVINDSHGHTFLQICPYAGQSPRLWLPPKYRQERAVSLSLLCLSFPVFLVLHVTALTSSSVPDTGVLFLSSLRRILVVSPLLPISIAR